MLFLLALVACDKDSGDSVAELDPPSPYIYEEEDPPTPALDADAVAAVIGEAVSGAFTLNATPVLEAYDAAVQGQEEGCPDYYSNDGNTYWYDYCYADDGSYFSGYGFSYLFNDYQDESGYIVDGTQVYVVADIVNGQGHTFSGSGAAYLVDYRWEAEGNIPHTISYSVIQGTFSYDGPEVAGSWMQDDVAPDLSLSTYWIPKDTSPNYYGRYVALDGGIGHLGAGDETVVMDGVVIFEETMASTCTLEPAGIISVRDSTGNWYDVTFDGPLEPGASSDPDACDGCGQIFYRGESLGQACVDFSTLLDWDERPW